MCGFIYVECRRCINSVRDDKMVKAILSTSEIVLIKFSNSTDLSASCHNFYYIVTLYFPDIKNYFPYLICLFCLSLFCNCFTFVSFFLVLSIQTFFVHCLIFIFLINFITENIKYQKNIRYQKI